jgi:release factor glutamine methyltransferase
MYTIGEILHRTANYFEEKGLENPRLNAEILLGHTLDLKRIDLYLAYDRPLAEPQLRDYGELIKRRVTGYPLQYITGETEFYGLSYQISPAVFIPRPETEILVESVLERLRQQKGPFQVADLGTGSGNIAVTLAHHLPLASIWATDRSPEALAVAQTNASKHGVARQIRFLQGDLSAPLTGQEGSFTAVICNPPYISSEDLKQLPVEIRDHEPALALDGGADGLDVIRRLISQVPPYLSNGGFLALEVGDGQAGEVVGLVARRGTFQPARAVRDYSGADRVVLAHRADHA